MNSSPPSDRKKYRLALLVLISVTAIAYAAGISGEWLFDDYPNIVSNWRVQPESITWDALITAAQGYQPGLYGRPLATIWFAVDFLIGGKNPFVFKLSGLLVHLFNTALVFFLARVLLTLPRVATRTSWPSWTFAAIALAWAIHPLQVSSVLYVVQRMETLSLTFVLLGLLTYLRGRRAQLIGRNGLRWIVLSGALAAIGMLSKESAILFPLYLLVLEVTVLGFDAARPATSRALRLWYIAVLIAGLVVFIGYVIPTYAAPGLMGGRDFTAYQRLLTQLRVLPMHLGQILFPVPGKMTFYYDSYPVSTGWLSPLSTLAGAALISALLAIAWKIRHSAPIVSLGIGWFFAAHALTSNIINLEMVYEHRNYFALLGVVLVLADLVRRIPTPDGPALKKVMVCIILSGLFFLTVLRSATWGDPMLLAMEHMHKNPTSPRASSDMGTLYYGLSGANPNDPYFSLAIAEFERGMELPGASPLPEQALILMAASGGIHAEPNWWTSLTGKLQTQPVGVQQIAALNGLVRARFDGAELDDAKLAQAYETLLNRGGLPRELYAQYGDYVFAFEGDAERSLEMYREAIRASGFDTQYTSRIVSNLETRGRTSAAISIRDWATENRFTAP